MGVDARHQQYDAALLRWERCRDAFEGEEAVKRKTTDYLPQLGGQSDDEYAAYLKRAQYYNATGRTVQGLVGSVFRKAPDVTVPDAQEALLEDISLTGLSMETLSRKCVQDVLIVGRGGLLVDMPETGSAAGLNEQRPFIKFYAAEQIVNWHTERRRGRIGLLLVVLSEKVEQRAADDPFSSQEITQYRVLELRGDVYTVSIWRADEKGNWGVVSQVVPLRLGKPFDFIPFTFLGPLESDSEVEKPPILDLVDTNLSHFRTMADLEHGRHFTGLPTPWVTGMDDETELTIGSSKAWILPLGSAAGMLEFKGEGLGALERASETKKAEMATLGARLLEEAKRGVEAADTIRTRRSDEQSVLKTIAISVGSSLTIALRWLVEWAGGDSAAAALKLNTGFLEETLGAAELQALMLLWQGGGIAKATMFYNMQRAELTRPGVTFEQEEAEIGAEDPAPALPAGVKGM